MLHLYMDMWDYPYFRNHSETERFQSICNNPCLNQSIAVVVVVVGQKDMHQSMYVVHDQNGHHFKDLLEDTRWLITDATFN